MKNLRSTIWVFLAGFIFSSLSLYSQDQIPVNGIRDDRNVPYCFQNGTLHLDDQQVIEGGTMIILNERITYAGTSKSAPEGAVVIDLEGKHLYPSFIDLYSSFGMPKSKKTQPKKGQQLNRKREGPYNWNDAIRSDVQAYKLFQNDPKKAEKILSTGFGVLLSSPNDGLMRGTSVLLALDPGSENNCILKEEAAEGYSFNKGSSQQDYPNSLLGSIALLRQTFYDAKWYEENRSKLDFDASLDAINRNRELPKIFRTMGRMNVLRANDLGKEFGIDFLIVGSGTEYQILEEVKGIKNGVVLPCNYPKPYDLTDPLTARNTGLKEMMDWELGPANAFYLDQAGRQIMFTLDGLDKETEFLPALRKAVKYGLPKSSALKALTVNPANFLGLDDQLGTLKTGKKANFFVADKDILEDGSQIREHWINGKRVLLKRPGLESASGEYSLKYNSNDFKATIGKSGIQVVKDDSIKMTAKGTADQEGISFSLNIKDEGIYRFTGRKSVNGYSGEFVDPKGSQGEFDLVRVGEIKKKGGKEKPEEKPEVPLISDLPFPYGPYGRTKRPDQEEFIIREATVWTNTQRGNGIMDVWVKDGKIFKVGEGLSAPGSIMSIDGKGKYLTSGIIDEHSHIALSSVNEGGQNSSAEVRMKDVINPESISMYRQLAGGVTAAQLLHGSANPVGGQSAIIKFRWGSSADELLIEDAPGFIKFALGENVKQSNWTNYYTYRYPKTRMGVEQVYEDLFTRAIEYEAKWAGYNSLSSKEKRTAAAPRIDLELETIAEIKNNERFITCHSYVQSEINMLMKFAEKYGFRVNTFTHILEGYKLADKMKEHGAGGSTFSDWWVYKYEVKDAIPYNSAIMAKVGVVTAVNSDDSEMARRLNQEAAKAVKYGGLSQEEAWKLVTLNPAKLLHLDHRMGMVEEGYDADLVIWNENPLSIYARVERTYIDGRCYYSEEIDLENRARIKKERIRLSQKMLKEKERGGKGFGKKPEKKEERIIDCDSQGNFDF